MAIIKCKMCGGDMELTADKTFGTCEYCGSTMTLPKIDDDQRAAAFNRGNHFRRIGEFDKALAVYESIVRENDTDAEAHWCCALCRFGIEYVEDPATYEWIPTCHRASFDSFLEDVDYLEAVKHSDGITQRQYQKDAAKIAEVQKGILSTSQNEEPYDVFICYKESDENGNRTPDSALAQDIYYQLTEQGRRVFFARITLEDVVGKQYEPYIFAALHSAKVMIVVGTKPEYLNAVWVKNEWSRFLIMMKKDCSKLLLPCYRDMNPYDMPEQLSILQSYDMSKIGFIQDLTRGIAKVLDAGKKPEAKETVVVQQSGGPGVESLLRRGQLFLEDGDWKSADEYFDKVLDISPECAEAYFGKALAAEKCVNADAFVQHRMQLYANAETKTLYLERADGRIEAAIEKYFIEEFLPQTELRNMFEFTLTYQSKISSRAGQKLNEETYWNSDKNLSRALQFGSEDAKHTQAAILTKLDDRIAMETQVTSAAREDRIAAYTAFLDEAEQKAKNLFAQREQQREDHYQKCCQGQNGIKTEQDALQIVEGFKVLGTYKDSAQRMEVCHVEAKRLKTEADRRAAEKAAARAADEKRAQIIQEKRKRKNKVARTVAVIVAVLALVSVLIVTKEIIPGNKYNAGLALMNKGEYEVAIEVFEAAGNYKDSRDMIIRCKTVPAVELASSGRYTEAVAMTEALTEQTDNEVLLKECKNAVADAGYGYAEVLKEAGKFEEAITAFEQLNGHRDSAEQIQNCKTGILDIQYNAGVELQKKGEILNAFSVFVALRGHKDSATKLLEMKLQYYEEALQTAEVGDSIYFGTFEQDNNKENGTENIEWVVIEKEGDRAKLISKDTLARRIYNSDERVYWKTSSLRSWLNDAFYYNAFDKGERKWIIETTVPAIRGSEGDSLGEDTQDNVFILDYEEAYNLPWSVRKSVATPAAQGEHVTEPVPSAWWVRSFRDSRDWMVADTVGYANENGTISSGGYGCGLENGVRPAIWIEIPN